MKYLSDYIKEEQTSLFDELGVFFAFSNEQFDEGAAKHAEKRPEGTKWAHLGAGMYMPSVNVDEFVKRHEQTVKSGIERDLKENGREGVLSRELGNYEIGYAYGGHKDINFRDAIEDYGFTEQEIVTAYNKHMEENEY